MVLRLPAQIALKSALAWNIGSIAYSPILTLCYEGISLQDACLGLKRNGYQRKDLVTLEEHPILHEHVNHILDNLVYNDLLKLALLTWHFDASEFLSPELLGLFDQPANEFEKLCVILCDQYNSRTRPTMSPGVFEQELKESLLSTVFRFWYRYLTSLSLIFWIGDN